MSQAIDYYFSVLSDWAYFGGERLEVLARRYGININHMPVRLSEIYAGTGGTLLQERPWQRQSYREVELRRWSDELEIPVNIHPRFYPVDDTLASCVIIATRHCGFDVGRVANVLLRAIWRDDEDISDPATIERILVTAFGSIACNGILTMARSLEAMEEFNRNTVSAQERGVFGSPFYFYNEEIFWGQDRLDFLEAAIVRAVSPARIANGDSVT